MGLRFIIKLKNYAIFSLVFILIAGTHIVYASDKAGVEVTPEEGDIVNGVEQDSNPGIQPRDVIVGPYFYSFKPNTKTHINKFKLVATCTLKNETGRTQKQTAKVTQSSSKGSEWNGNISFSAKIKAGILGKMETKIGAGLKQSRSKNEAVGYSCTMNVSAKRKGTVKIYYSGWKSAGKLKTYTIFTANPKSRVYKTTDVNATVYKSKSLDIYTTMSEKKL